ncbi:hypothetical protein [Anaeromyxobacter paludicola]|uniref:hypothetical protein n=1 Tax=Anaeromyxobacter paludicola TaxID=2918171 RepID=UPI0020BF3A3E|nr:hypothetical protein [Anaeromyxobacter paludicola]
MVQEVMRQHPEGARLVLRAGGDEGWSVVACSIGFQWGRTPVFAYLVPVPDGPPFWEEGRVYVEHLTRRGTCWLIGCRDERGTTEVEVQALRGDEAVAVRCWRDALPEEVLDDMDTAMRSMLDPRAL